MCIHSNLALISKNKKLLRNIINSNYPLSTWIDCSNKTLFCPFHYNIDTPSAQLYSDIDGITRLYCFSENRQYTSYDYIKLILGKDPISFLYNIQIDESIIEEELDRLENIKNIEIDLISSKFNLDINSFFKQIYEETK